MTKAEATKNLVRTVRKLAKANQSHLKQLKKNHADLKRPDFLWHYLLQSFATMGRASGWVGLIDTPKNYNRVRYQAISGLSPASRRKQVLSACRDAGVRMPNRKAEFIIGCFDKVKKMGGPKAAKKTLLDIEGKEGKLDFLKSFPGIGPKYARNIMMDVYHEEFRDSIAIDARLKSISEELGLRFASYDDHEQFYLRVARLANIEGWELDRLLFNYWKEVEEEIRT